MVGSVVRSRVLPLFASMVVLASIALAIPPPALDGSTAGAAPRVLHVGTWSGHKGEFATIQAAVDAAQPGDWILIAPGDYHERADYSVANPVEAGAGVMITTPGIHLRGMDRNGVVVDGTKPGAPDCSTAPGDQDFGPLDGSSQPLGRNGILVFEASDVTVDNLTTCNFLTGSGGGGNEIWFNGGDGSGTTNLDGYEGSYLTATSTFYADGQGDGEYGIFASNVNGPGTLAHTYASNMADGAYYIGACPDCNTVVDDAHGQGSALGYSGTNSGGRLVIQNSEFDLNKTGFSTNSQNNDDAPSPQDGVCPPGLVGPTGTSSCWVFQNNFVHDNNNANVPGSGSAELGPPGTGIVISGGRNDTVIGNRFENNGSWAVLVAPFIDTGSPPPVAHCDGGVTPFLGEPWCYFAPGGNEIAGNTFVNNGGFGNETNGDLADLSELYDPGNCWHDNTDAAGVSTAPVDLQTTNGVCGVPNQGAPIIGSPLSDQVICATEVFGPCPPTPGMDYPRRTSVQLVPLTDQPTMPDPCAGVPDDTWCPAPLPVAVPAVVTRPFFTG